MNYPKPLDLWEMNSRDFNQWRKANDLKKLFDSFQNLLPYFDEWLTDNKLTVDFILNTDQPGQFFYWRGPSYVFIETKENSEHFFFVHIDDDKHEKRILNVNKNEKEDNTLKYYRFLPYFFWIRKVKHIDKPLKTKYSGEQETFQYIMRGAPDVPEMCSAAISPGITVLKLGGCKIDSWGQLKHRNLDFTNLDFLEIDGKFDWGSNGLDVFYASCHHILINNTTVHFTNFYCCAFQDLKVTNTRLYWATFKDCDMFKAFFENSSISNMIVDNCSANNFSFNRVEVENIEYIPPTKEYHCGVALTYQTVADNYKRLRMLYQSNGLRQEASESYYNERLYEMKYSFREIDIKRTFSYVINRDYYHGIYPIKLAALKISKVMSDVLSYMLWGFGERPLRILSSSFSVLILYAFIYFISDIENLKYEIVNSCYLSIVTFTTLGFGDITPMHNNAYKLIVGSEALIGAFFMGLLVAGFANKSRY